MVEYNKVNVKLTYVQLKKVKAAVKNKTGTTLILFRIVGGEAKTVPIPVFSPITSTNVGISPQNFLTFNYNPFDRLV